MIFGVVNSYSSASTTTETKSNSVVELDKIEQLEIEALLDQLVSIRLQKSYLSSTISKNARFSTLEIQTLSKAEATVMSNLNSKGVRYLTEEEIKTLNNSSIDVDDNIPQISALASSPPTWGPYAYVDMLTAGEKTITVNNQTYKIWINYAIPKDNGGPPLAKHYDAVKLTNTPLETSIFANKILSLLISTYFGEIPYAQWIPSDIFWPTGSSYTSFNTYELSVSYASRMKYVWQYLPNGTWQLKGSSNNIHLKEFHLGRGIKNGLVSSIDFNVSRFIYADDYDDIETLAVTSSGYYTSAVGNLKYKNANGGTALTVEPYFANYAPDLFH